ncbi:MAG: ribosome biogenesis GTPase Der, partial [Spirochaetales bacterium]|nr:ribosome biogenesis GTPase Der [Spirochaetales bacterium]
ATGDNIGPMLDTALRVYAQLGRRIDTAALNNALKVWGEAYQPSRGAEGHYKVYYGTQISAQPVRFLFFINRKKDFPQTYVQYLKNCIRRDLGFTDVPVEIDLRERERSESNHKLGQKAKVRPAEERELPKAKPVRKEQSQGGKAKAKPAAKKVGAKAKAIAVKKARESYSSRKKSKAKA